MNLPTRAELGNIGDKFQTEQLRMKDKGQADCCPTESQDHCTNIGDKFQTEQLRMKDKGEADCCPTKSQDHRYKS
jgi:hypothetical protein